MCALGTYRSPSSGQAASRIYSLVSDEYARRNTIYNFDFTVGNSYEILGPPAYNRVTRTLFVFVANHASTNQPFAIHRFVLQEETSILQEQGVFFTYTQSGSGTMRSSILGASLRMDADTLVAVDDRFKKIYIFPVQGRTSTTGPAYNTSYNLTLYRDLEFIGTVSSSSKLFLTSFEANSSRLYAELYVQCAPCRDGGITLTTRPAESAADCMCRPGSYVTEDGGCESCQCSAGEYQSGEQCLTGRETSKVRKIHHAWPWRLQTRLLTH